jgi:CRP-like cAMP-binding protein
VGTIADELSTIPFLSRASGADLRASAPLWEQLSLTAGEVLWEEGAAVDELAILVVGELVAELDGTAVGKVLPGELLGEASAFFTGTARTASLRARTAAQVLVLAVPSLRTLRWQRSGVYDALLEQALVTLVRRIRATDQRVAQVATGGVAAPARTEPSALVRLWRTLRPGGPTGPCPPIEPLLRAQPGMRDADGEIIAALSQAFVAEPVTEGQVVFLEGETGAAAWLVADGQVDVLRHVRGERAELLAALGTGCLFGINTLVERGARTASCVAARPGWLYRMDAEAFGKLRGGIRLAWRESLLGALATQIRGANASLQRATTGKATPKARAAAPSGDEAFQDLLRASGWLEGLPAGDLERMEVVMDEDARRNPRKKR